MNGLTFHFAVGEKRHLENLVPWAQLLMERAKEYLTARHFKPEN